MGSQENLITNPANLDQLVRILTKKEPWIELDSVKYYGGGFVAETAKVAETAYVGPFALVIGLA